MIAVAPRWLRSQSMKIRPVRLALDMVATKRSGSAPASARAKRSAKSLTAGHSASGLRGTTTCTPLPPESSGKLVRPISARWFLRSWAAFFTAAKSSPTSGSRSNTRRSGFSSAAPVEPQPWNSLVPICTQAASPSALALDGGGALHAGGGGCGKGDLGDQIGGHPVRAAHRRARRLDGRCLALDPRHLRLQILHRVDIEAGADLAGIDQ